MSDLSRQERLNVLLRKRKGQSKRDALAELLGGSSQEWRIVVPPDSDPIRESLFESVRANRRDGRLDLRADVEFQHELDRLLASVPATAPVVLALSDAATIGVVESTVDLARSRAKALLDHDRDSLVVADPGGAWGLVCQRFENAGVSYQIESWGTS